MHKRKGCSNTREIFKNRDGKKLSQKSIKAFPISNGVNQNLLEEALIANYIAYSREARIKIYSNDTWKVVGTYIPDFLVDDKIIVELKSSHYTTKTDEKQLYHYLRNSPYPVGYLVNFSTPQLYIKRIIYTNDRKPFLERRK